MKFIFLIGRILFSSIFIIKAFDHFSSKTVDYATQSGILSAPFWVPLSGVIALLGGLSILLGFKAKIGSWLLVLFLLPTTFMIHNFWQADDSFAAMMHEYCFWKNLSMMGAALMIAYFGSGPLSLDNRSCCR